MWSPVKELRSRMPGVVGVEGERTCQGILATYDPNDDDSTTIVIFTDVIN